MREVCAHRVVTNELWLDIDPGQTEFVDGKYGDLLFTEFIEQGDGHEWMTRLLHRLVEQRSVFGGQVQQAHHLIQLYFDVRGAFAGDGQVEAGTVVGEDHAVAVVDQTARGVIGNTWTRLFSEMVE